MTSAANGGRGAGSRSGAALARLTGLLPPPEAPTDPGDPEAWPEVEATLGVALPADYKAFVEAYGTGTIDGFLLVLNPFADGAGYRLQDYGRTMLDTMRAIQANGTEGLPYALHPEPEGLLPWGYTGNGDWCYWVAEPSDDPDRWRIALNGSRSAEWFEHAGPLVSLIAELVSRRLRVPFLPDDFPAEGAAFAPLVRR